MEQFRTTPRLVRGPAPQAYASVAWRAPEPRREPIRPANDLADSRDQVAGEAGDSRWVIVVLGALVAAVLGMMLGGAMAI